VILATSSRNRARKLTDTDEDGEVAQPNQNEAVDEASRSAAVITSSVAADFLYRSGTYLWKPIEKILP